jgi:hypothetical protein
MAIEIFFFFEKKKGFEIPLINKNFNCEIHPILREKICLD